MARWALRFLRGLAGGMLLGTALTGCSRGANPLAATPRTLRAADIVAAPITRFRTQGCTLYRVFYKYRGQRLEAYLTVPNSAGPHPLLVNLHGGFAADTYTPHYDFGYGAESVAAVSSPNYVALYPEYQGYLASSGYVRGVYTDTVDTLAAIRLVEALLPIDRHRIYLIGYSVGGAVALKVAGILSGVRAVVAVSPYVGLRTVLPWEVAHAPPGSNFYIQMILSQTSYGNQPSRETLAQESPDIATITAPVLLLQGTADHSVPWQTVQQFYQAMKSARKAVKLVLYAGGHHGLGSKYVKQSTQAIHAWFQKYGVLFDY